MAPSDSLGSVGGAAAPDNAPRPAAKAALGAVPNANPEHKESAPVAGSSPAQVRLSPTDDGKLSLPARKLAESDQKDAEAKQDPQAEFKTSSGANLRFQVNKEDGSVTITMIDPVTKEIVRTIPQNELSKMGYDHFLNLFA